MEILNGLAAEWWNWMRPMFFQTTLLVVLITIVDRLIRNRVWPQVRYALWILVFVKLLIPPGLHLSSGIIPRLLPAQAGRILAVPAGYTPAPEHLIREAKSVQALPDGPVFEEPVRRIHPTASGDTGPSRILIAMGIWLSGVVLFGLLLLFRIARLRSWHKHQHPTREIPPWFHEVLVGTAGRLDISRLPAVVFSRDVASPAVYGLWRPVLLLPADCFRSLSPQEAEHVLIHELAHLKRGDLPVHALCLLLQVMYWFNPFIYWTKRQMKHVREICCDLTVARELQEDTMKYRQTLIQTARRMLTRSPQLGLGLLGIFEDPFRLITRIQWLGKSRRSAGRVVMPVVAVLTMAMLLFVLPMSPAPGNGNSPPESRESRNRATLTYRFPAGVVLPYHLDLQGTEWTQLNGNKVEVKGRRNIRFTVTSAGKSGEDHRLNVTLDKVEVRQILPWTTQLPHVSHLAGARFELILSPQGRENAFLKDEGLDVMVTKEHAVSIVESFKGAFPDLNSKAVGPGDSWKTSEQFTIRGMLPIEISSDSVHTLKEFRYDNGRRIAVVRTRLTGTVYSKSRIEGSAAEMKGTLSGTSNWEFLVDSGSLLRDDGEFSMHASLSSNGKSIPMHNHTRTLLELISPEDQ